MPYRNIRLNPVLRLTYLLLRLYAWVTMHVFYRRRTVLGAENLRFDGPAIVICNHPSTLMDVLNAGLPIRQEMFFLANYGLFKHPVANWLLTRLFCIPVKRREDVAEGEERNNDAAFEMSYKHLEANGVLFVAAEGVSFMNRWVRPFKTGTARIAFGTEQRNGWNLGVVVVPVGLSYSAPNLFRSEVVVHIGKPVPAREWVAAWQQDREQAIDDFTVSLQQKVSSLTVDTRDEAGERLVGHWEEMLRNAQPLPANAAFLRSQRLTGAPLDDNDLREKTDAYFDRLKAQNLRDVGLRIAETDLPWYYTLLLVLGFPFFLAGYLFWFLPCYVPGLLAKKLKLYVGYDSNIKTVVGSVTFGLALAWAPWAAGVHNRWAAGLIILCCIGLGYFTEWYLDVWARWRAYRQVRGLDSAERNQLQVQRREIITALQKEAAVI